MKPAILEEKEYPEYWSDSEKRLRTMFKEMKEKHGMLALKLGTEVEDCSFEYIDYLNKLTRGIMPIVVKIGGPDARNDMRKLLEIGVSGLIAPMVESHYGLKNFIEALKEIATEGQFRFLLKAINIETVYSYQHLDQILGSPEAEELQQITVGRSDLSKSVGKTVDDIEVMKMTKEITRKAQAAGLVVSVGGGITPSNARRIAEEIKPDKMNTRHVVISLRHCPDPGEAIRKGLELEAALMRNEQEKLNARVSVLEKRVKELEKRTSKY
jgi:hypothetical protein